MSFKSFPIDNVTHSKLERSLRRQRGEHSDGNMKSPNYKDTGSVFESNYGYMFELGREKKPKLSITTSKFCIIHKANITLNKDSNHFEIISLSQSGWNHF